ncbi:MAG TPA: PepSY domain-containing protein, partial [Polyangiaceae bacterium]|nr:PepSY domain-containing protein [Polyangiaceae bacterium]
TVRVDARSGEVAPVSRAEAETIARRDQPDSPGVRETTLVEGTAPLEYRDCEHSECTLPAYRVALADASRTAVYVDAVTGDVTARRNDRWRLYDFFWSLHIMDYRAREDFNHALIRGASLLAVATVLSGIAVLALRATRWVRRRVRRTEA